MFASADNGQSWTGLGGNTIMVGRINALAFDTAGLLLAATEQGGVRYWNGAVWTALNTGLVTACGITQPIRAIAVDGEGAYYAGAHGFGACFPAGDLYRFDGMAWTSVAAGLTDTDVNTLAVHPLTGRVYAGTDGGGVFRRDDTSWTAVSDGLSDWTVHKLRFAPNGDLYAGTNTGLAKLPAGSAAWTDLDSGLPGDPARAIAIDSAHLLVGTGYGIEQTGSLYGRLYTSADGGDSWAQTAASLQTTAVNALVFADDGAIIGGGWGLFRSTDDGANWAAANTGFSARTFNTQGRIAVTPGPNPILFYGTDDGVFTSADEGASWTMASNGLTRRMVTLLKCDSQGNLFCATMRYMPENSGFGDGVLYKSTDEGETWTPVVISKDWRYYEIAELPNGDLICAHGFGAQPPSASITGSSLALSQDGGDTWTDLDLKTGMAFCCAANAQGALFVAGESAGVYRSIDGGGSFALVPAPGQSGNVGTLEVSPSGEILMSSGGQRTLYFSTDNGGAYEAFTSPVLPDYRGVSDVIFDHGGTAYCTTAGQGGSPNLFVIAPPFVAGSDFTPVAGPAGSFFKMTWDACGYLYIYTPGAVVKSAEPLNLPGDECDDPSTGVFAKEPSRQIVFPNPAFDYFQLKIENGQRCEVALFDLNGRKIAAQTMESGAEISVRELPPGIYFVKIVTAGSALAQWAKIVKG